MKPAVYGGPGGDIVLYRAPDGTVSLDVRLEKDTLAAIVARLLHRAGNRPLEPVT